jgi:hypothetical protein
VHPAGRDLAADVELPGAVAQVALDPGLRAVELVVRAEQFERVDRRGRRRGEGSATLDVDRLAQVQVPEAGDQIEPVGEDGQRLPPDVGLGAVEFRRRVDVNEPGLGAVRAGVLEEGAAPDRRVPLRDKCA